VASARTIYAARVAMRTAAFISPGRAMREMRPLPAAVSTACSAWRSLVSISRLAPGASHRGAAAVTRRTTEESATRALLDAHVAVLGSGRCAKTTASQLEEIGIGRVDLLAPADEPAAGALVVAVPSARELPELERVNERALELGTAWLQVLPFDGRLTIVGPLYLPNASACRCCFVLRRGACSGYEDDFELVESQPSRALSPTPLTTMAAGLAANVVLRWMTAKDPTLPGRFYALESRTILRLSYEHVLRVPRCPACGPAASAVPSPWFEESP